MSSDIRTVSVVGAGFLGSQIAAWSLVHGYVVHIQDINSEALKKAQGIIEQTIELYHTQDASTGNSEEEMGRMFYHESLAEAVKDADLIIEAVPENLAIKKEVFIQIDRAAPSHAIIATNSSSIPVSRIEGIVHRKDKVLNLHFYSPSQFPMIDIMRGSVTSDETFEKGMKWIESIECVPLVVKKEIFGFVFNRIWHEARKDALKLWSEGYADLRDIDRAWMIFTGMGMGPFGIMDGIGLDVVYDVEMMYYNESGDARDKPPDALKEMIERGELGIKSGRGFYDWSDPEFAKPDFITVKRRG
jgi:3-hydroxybutyryl-CoA dehydrogenase